MTAEAATVSPEDLRDLKKWIATHPGILPKAGELLLRHVFGLIDSLHQSRHRLSRSLNTIRHLLGVVPKSERRSVDGSGKDSAEPRERRRRRSRREVLEDERARLEERSDALKRRNDELRKDLRKINRELDRIAAQEDARDMSDDTQPTPEAVIKQSVEEHMARLTAGDGKVDPRLTRPDESIIHSAVITSTEQDDEPVAPDPSEYDAALVKGTIVEQRVRYEFTLAIERRVFEVEKKVVVEPDGTRRIISPSTACYGPPKFSVTWKFLVNITIMVISGAIPMNRLARFISTEEKQFGSGTLYKMLHYVAQRFVPVYVHLFDLLANAPVLSGDDTPAKVLQVTQHFRKGGTEADAPWRDWGRPIPVVEPTAGANECSEEPKKRPELSDRLAREFGLVFARRSGKGKKQTCHTSVISGRSVADDPRSEITFYRSHLGGLGNLLEALLHRRDGKLKEVPFQCDLSTVNLVADPILRQKFELLIFGCGAHARRPFKRYEKDDPRLCGLMLALFGEISHCEKSLDIAGRNEHNVKAVRDVDERDSWNEILNLAKLINTQWSGSSNMGEGARYIERHYEALTRYLGDVRMAWSNNHSERDLRGEKMTQSSSMFRVSLEGRCVLDVMRTIGQTAAAAKVPLAAYLEFVLRADPKDVEQSPGAYTPHAWALEHMPSTDDDECDELDGELPFRQT